MAVTSATAKTTISLLAKTAGLAGMAAVVYDSHKCGKSDARIRESSEAADILIKQYNDSRILNSRSTIVSKLQNALFQIRLNSGFSGFMAKLKGYVSGFSSNVAHNVIAVGLSAGALFLKKGSKLCAAGLGVVALKTLVYDVLGVGRSPKRNI